MKKIKETGVIGPIRSGRRDWAKFLTLHSWSQATIHKAHSEYTKSILNLDLIKQNKYKGNSKDNQQTNTVTNQCWSYVKSKRKDATGVAPLHSNTVLVSDTYGKTNTLNQQYASIFCKEEGDIPSKCVIPTLSWRTSTSARQVSPNCWKCRIQINAVNMIRSHQKC